MLMFTCSKVLHGIPNASPVRTGELCATFGLFMLWLGSFERTICSTTEKMEFLHKMYQKYSYNSASICGKVNSCFEMIDYYYTRNVTIVC